ncbi:MAG TPA: amidohydrolase [Candidatus Dormibacteraeota bacterium]|jgi:hypothetical protein|nr:amidohydrolase [Candidatus Dormibacteraeota bacterium]
MAETPATWFRGASIEVVTDSGGRIVAAGPGAGDAAPRSIRVVELRGELLPGLHDAHLHLDGLVGSKLGVELEGCSTRGEALARVAAHARGLGAGDWLIGRGWYNDAWGDDPGFPDRTLLDGVAGGRPAVLWRKDGHSAWVSTAALRAAGVVRGGPDPKGGVIDRDARGEPTGILRESAMDLVGRILPEPAAAEVDRAMTEVLHDLARLGLTSVTSMDPIADFGVLQRLHRRSPLPIRVNYNVPVAELEAAVRMGVHSGLGDARLRIWGVKAFLDGSLGSRTAAMLDGTGVSLYTVAELEELGRRCADARLNVCWHAIGDAAVRNALDALEPMAGAWDGWRPRIEHAQCVRAEDRPRFRSAAVIASMQPIHAVTDRELADREWPGLTADAYAWSALEAAGAVLAFGSDAPVETADPLPGLAAATTWRQQAAWHTELALTRESALRAYTAGAAYAVGMEAELGSIGPGYRCDLTVVEGDRVTATVVDGEVVWQA